jgi:uncharacterized protein (TIGR00725 family)
MKSNYIIGVIGASNAGESDKNIAFEIGREIAINNCTLLCGGMGGIMEAACRGAKTIGGITIGILPGASSSDGNDYIDIPIVTGLSHARNIIIVRSSNVIIAIGGEFGTLSEIAFALKLNTPVIGVNTWDVSDNIIKATTAKDAVNKALNLINSNASSNEL